MRKNLVYALGLCFSFLPTWSAPPTPMEPMRVCDVLRDLSAQRGKPVAVVGRYSFRENGRFLSEEACDHKVSTGTFVWPNVLRLVTDTNSGPKLPEDFSIDSAAADQKLRLIQKTTALAKFRFGSLEYDRWAIVYGRVDPVPELESRPEGLRVSKSGLEPAPAHLVYRGDGLIFFITTVE